MKTPKGNTYCEMCHKQVFKRGKDWRFKCHEHPNQRIICYDCVPVSRKTTAEFFIL